MFLLPVYALNPVRLEELQVFDAVVTAFNDFPLGDEVLHRIPEVAQFAGSLALRVLRADTPYRDVKEVRVREVDAERCFEAPVSCQRYCPVIEYSVLDGLSVQCFRKIDARLAEHGSERRFHLRAVAQYLQCEVRQPRVA